jgi:hypothetical protein
MHAYIIHYLLKFIEKPALIYYTMYYWPTVGIRYT